MTVLGHVAELWRYPVKSMAGERLDAAEVGWHGLPGDRRWGFVQDALVRSGFPYQTIRERSEMVRYRPRLVEPGDPDRSAVMVRTPGGEELAVDDPALAADVAEGIHPIKLDRGVFDAAPLSLISRQTVEALGGLVGRELAPVRFRANLVVDAAGEWPEDGWVGRVLRVGGMRMRIDRRDSRCVVINVDPDSAERDARVLRAVAQQRQACLGVYGSVVEPGPVRTGDEVRLDQEEET